MLESKPKIRSKDRKSTKVSTVLDDGFRPSPYSVICGRGKRFFDAVGNRRLKVTASLFFNQYSKADKDGKMAIVSTIIAITRAACPKGAFIKLVEGRWVEVNDRTVREKVGSVLRDYLHEQYRSSSKSKVARRKSIKVTSNDTRRKAKRSKPHHPPKSSSKIEPSIPVALLSLSFEASDLLHRELSEDNLPCAPHPHPKEPPDTTLNSMLFPIITNSDLSCSVSVASFENLSIVTDFDDGIVMDEVEYIF